MSENDGAYHPTLTPDHAAKHLPELTFNASQSTSRKSLEQLTTHPPHPSLDTSSQGARIQYFSEGYVY